MATPILMPRFGMAQEEATVIRWMVEEGASVEKGDPILEVETDKVTMEVEAPQTGVVGGFLVGEGDVVPITEVIAYLLQPGESLPQSAARSRAAKEGDDATAEPQTTDGAGGRPRRVTPVARRVAQAAGLDVSQIPMAGDDPKITRKDVEAYLSQNEEEAAASHDRVRATPAARRVAREGDVDLAQIAGSGPRGRVQEADVVAFVSRDRPGTTQRPTGPAIAEVIPLRGMRRTVAERMQRSYQTAPHITFNVEVDVSAVEALRHKLNERGAAEERAPVSVTVVLVKACAWALQRHRLLNASLQGEEIHIYEESNIGIAVALEDGLIVPVIHRADQMGLAAIAERLRQLTERARQGTLGPEEVSKGTFTISNLGMFGVDHFTALINPPQSAILAVGRIARRQIVLEAEAGDEVAIRPVMQMTLSADHRVLDGAAAARFLQDLSAALTDPGLMLW